MTAPLALVLKAPGTNCERESIDALERAGARTELLTTLELLAAPERLERARMLVFPGGFAHGDDIASARIWANQCRRRIGPEILRFVHEDGGHVLGICNGFQVLVKLGLLPGQQGGLEQEVSLVHNDSGHYECRWVRMRVTASPCSFLPEGELWEMPVGHAEGKFVPGPGFDAGTSPLVALRYVDPEGQVTGRHPHNPNGSVAAVAGLTDPTGRVLGLMPHPDRSYLTRQHPRRRHAPPMAGAELFARLVRAAKK